VDTFALSVGARQSESFWNTWAMRQGPLNKEHISANGKFLTKRDIKFTSRLHDDYRVHFLKLQFWTFAEAIKILKLCFQIEGNRVRKGTLFVGPSAQLLRTCGSLIYSVVTYKKCDRLVYENHLICLESLYVCIYIYIYMRVCVCVCVCVFVINSFRVLCWALAVFSVSTPYTQPVKFIRRRISKASTYRQNNKNT
jgi:hypothetical protein